MGALRGEAEEKGTHYVCSKAEAHEQDKHGKNFLLS